MAPITGMRVQCGIIGYDDCVFGDKHGARTEFQGLRTRAGRLGDCNGGVETYCFKLARVFQADSM